MISKNTSQDIFQDTVVNGVRMYPEKSLNNKVKFKMQKTKKEGLYMKLQFLKSLGILNGMIRLEVNLKLITLAKEIFILNIGEGTPVYIPNELSQRVLPYSYKYYDPIISLIKNDLPTDQK